MRKNAIFVYVLRFALRVNLLRWKKNEWPEQKLVLSKNRTLDNCIRRVIDQSYLFLIIAAHAMLWLMWFNFKNHYGFGEESTRLYQCNKYIKITVYKITVKNQHQFWNSTKKRSIVYDCKCTYLIKNIANVNKFVKQVFIYIKTNMAMSQIL